MVRMARNGASRADSAFFWTCQTKINGLPWDGQPDIVPPVKMSTSMGLSTRYIAKTGEVKQERPRVQDHPEI